MVIFWANACVEALKRLKRASLGVVMLSEAKHLRLSAFFAGRRIRQRFFASLRMTTLFYASTLQRFNALITLPFPGQALVPLPPFCAKRRSYRPLRPTPPDSHK
jgi:hypothetical protein